MVPSKCTWPWEHYKKISCHRFLITTLKGSKEQVPNDLHKLISRKIRVAEKSSNFHTVWKFEESGEVLPYLVKKQFSKNKYHSADTISEWHTKFQSSKWQKNNCHFGMTILVIWKTRTEIGLWDVLLISLRVVHVSMRANTMQAYCELNRQIASLLPTLSHNQLPIQMHPNTNDQPKAQVSNFLSNRTLWELCVQLFNLTILLGWFWMLCGWR